MGRVVVRGHERAVVVVDGAVHAVLGAGRHRVPRRFGLGRVEVTHVDLRVRWLLLPAQEVLAADLPGAKVSVAVRWRVADPVAFLAVAVDAQEQLRVVTQLALRDAVAATALEDLVAGRGQVGATVAARVAPAVAEVGLEVLGVDVRDVVMPGEVRRALLEVETARREGQAALERARGETAALRALANGARVLADHPALLQLRTAQVAGESGGTVVVHSVGDRAGGAA